MADTQSKPASSTSSGKTARPVADTTATDTRADRTADVTDLEAQLGPIPMEDGKIVPTPGDPRTEPVATAAQSHVAGRVGPRTIPEDATSLQPAGDELDEVEPGQVRTDTWEGTGPVPVTETAADPVGEGLNRMVERIEAAKVADHDPEAARVALEGVERTGRGGNAYGPVA